MTSEHDGCEACALCGAPSFASHSDGEVAAGYGSRHDTTRFVELAPPGGVSPFPTSGGPVCDGCIDRLLVEGRLVAWTAFVGTRPAELTAPTLAAVFMMGARRARMRVEEARAGRFDGAEAALATLSGAIDLPRRDRAITISLAPAPAHRADPYTAGAATALALAACQRPFGEADIGPLAIEWAAGVVRDREARVDALALLATLGDGPEGEDEG